PVISHVFLLNPPPTTKVSTLSLHDALPICNLPREPLTALLRAQTAQLRGDRDAARRSFEAMLDRPETELLGLRGLFLEAHRSNEDRKSTRLNSSHSQISYAVFCLKQKTQSY